MNLFAVVLQNPGMWVEFYWADDADHAREQAKDANTSAQIACVATVPEVYVNYEAVAHA